jgi:hypothetical protein
MFKVFRYSIETALLLHPVLHIPGSLNRFSVSNNQFVIAVTKKVNIFIR